MDKNRVAPSLWQLGRVDARSRSLAGDYISSPRLRPIPIARRAKFDNSQATEAFELAFRDSGAARCAKQPTHNPISLASCVNTNTLSFQPHYNTL